jgi:hypothetical protein
VSIGLYGISYGLGAFVAVGNFGTILTSPDGKTWTDRSPNIVEPFFDALFAQNTFVVVGDWKMILQSPVLSAQTLSLDVTREPSSPTSVRVIIRGQPGQIAALQASTSLSQWLTIANLPLTDGTATFLDSHSTNFTQRVYRAVIP